MRKIKTGYPSIDLSHEKKISISKRYPIIPNLTIFNALRLLSGFYRPSIAVDCLDLSATFQNLIDDSVMISKAFSELDVKKGSIVTAVMPNFYQALLVFFAANRIGATVTFLNSFSEIGEVENYLNLFESPVLINYDVSDEYNNRILKNTKVKNVITLRKENICNRVYTETGCLTGYSSNIDFDQLIDYSKFNNNIFHTSYNGNSDALILFTSGTTGAPKPVVLTNKNIIAASVYLKNTSLVKNEVGEKSLVCVPFTYPYGFSTSALMSLMSGRQVILAPDLSQETIPYYYSKKPNYVFGSPAFLDLTMRCVPDNQDLSSVSTFISGGDFLTINKSNVAKSFFQKHGAEVEISNGSGNAETVSCGTNSLGQPLRVETVGKVLYGTKNIIIDPDTGQEKKYGEEGMLCVSGEHVFKEYYGYPDKTKDAKFEYKGREYFKTGTMGFLDEEGYFTLTGRESRFYIIKTLNKVYCDRVQNILNGIDVIDSCAVVKKPDDDMLYVNKAFIVLKDGVPENEETLQYIKNKCREAIVMPLTGELAQFKTYEIPSSFEFVEFLPRNEKSEKINYDLLEKLAEQEYIEQKKQVKRLTL